MSPTFGSRDLAGPLARAASSQAAVDPAITFMKLRRRICLPRRFRTAPTVAYGDAITALQQGFATGEMGALCTAAILSSQ